ncbi:cytidylyltransferase domain-containing protein [Aliarcobacter cryaerophilus]
MKKIVVIPARLNSSRLPNKVLHGKKATDSAEVFSLKILL